ncbi:MAG: hypothetical protein ACRDTC_25205 [Pseudonocardiaceae bacterium]
MALTKFPAAELTTARSAGALVDVPRAELSPIPRRIGTEKVEQVRELTAQAFDSTQRFGGGGVRERLGGQLRWAVGLRDALLDPSACGPCIPRSVTWPGSLEGSLLPGRACRSHRLCPLAAGLTWTRRG